MEKMKKRIKLKKGFTLVEIIVVLVILAILAAFTIPTMLGFVNDAKAKAYIAEAREVYVAAQSVATEYIATTNIMDGNVAGGTPSANGNASWGTGLGVSLSSYEVQFRHAQGSPNTTPQGKASGQMYAYISNDLLPISNINLLTATPNPNARPNGKDAAWSVTVGDTPDTYNGNAAATRTGKVTKVVYLKDGFRVTITGNNATAEKW